MVKNGVELFRLLAPLLFFLLLLMGGCRQKPAPFVCNDSLGCVSVGSGEPMKLGVLQALSGKVASLGQEQIHGIELAIMQRERQILGHPIALQIEDDGCTAEGGANAALKIIADPQIVAILGSTCSGAAVTAAQAVSDAGLVMISGNNSAPFLTSVAGKPAPHWHAGYFRTVPNEETAGRAAAQYAYEKLGLRKAATINDGDIYTQGLTSGFEAAFRQLGGEIVLSTAVDKKDEQMEPVLTAVINARADILFFPLFQPEGNHILLQAKAMTGFEDIILMSDGALLDTTFLEAVGEKGKGLYFVGPDKATGPAIEALEAQYRVAFKSSPAVNYYQNAFDAANLLFAAIEKVAVLDPSGSLHVGRQALREAMVKTSHFKGVTGQLSCDQFGDCAVPVFNVLRCDDPAAGLEGLQKNVMFHYPEKS